jgi:molybdate transport system regulatory protein
MEMKLRIYLQDNGLKFMGVGVYWLLKEIGKCGSLRKAALSLDISYTKAFRMISTLEESLGVRVLDRHHGGQARDGAVLTTFGEEFILLYEDFQNRSNELVGEAFRNFSGKLEKLKDACGEKLTKEAACDKNEV